MKKYTKLSDAELIEQYYIENKDAQYILKILINRYSDKFYGYILKAVQDSEIAEDILQETFINIIRKLRKKDLIGGDNFFDSLVRISNVLILEHLKKIEQHQLFSEGKYQEESPLNLFFNIDEFNKNEIVEVISLLSKIYKTISGDGLIIKKMSCFEYVNELQPVEL